MDSWSLSNETGRTYTRALGTTELLFYWDGLYNGASDTVQHVAVTVTNDEVFALKNVARAWLRMKHRFPLLGAQLKEQDAGRRKIQFVVHEASLVHLGLGELELHQISSSKEVQELLSQLVNGPRRLSNQLLARVFILVQDLHRYHIIFHTLHCISDGISNFLLCRAMLEELTSSHSNDWKLEDRLALSSSSESLYASGQSRAKQRWHQAMGSVTWLLRRQRHLGGHTLPRTYTRLTNNTHATSGSITHAFDIDQSSLMLKHCRKLGVTFGAALPVLGQVALTRLLCRRYLQGNISAEEWDFRRREPMATFGPINIRPFLDRAWYEKGGASNVCLAIGYFIYSLPYMPLGAAFHLVPGEKLPTYHDLLSCQRFALRAKMLRKQAEQSVNHPLFLDKNSAYLRYKMEYSRQRVLACMEDGSQRQGHDAEVIPLIEQSQNEMIFCHGGSSVGNIDSILPQTFRGSRTVIRVDDALTALHCRPSDLYLGSTTVGKRLRLWIFWDKNVYDDATVTEWVADLVDAAEHYLAGSTSVKL